MTTKTKPETNPTADEAAARLAALNDHAAIKQAGEVGYNAASSLGASFCAYVTRRSELGVPSWDTAVTLLRQITAISPVGSDTTAVNITGCTIDQIIADLRRRGGLTDDDQPPVQPPPAQEPPAQEPVDQARRQLQSLLDELRDDIAGISDDRPPASVEVFDLRTRLQTVAAELIGIAVILGGTEPKPYR